MDLPVQAIEKQKYICAFHVHSMDVFVEWRLQAVLPVQLGIGDDQSEWRVLDLRPEEVTFHSRRTSL